MLKFGAVSYTLNRTTPPAAEGKNCLGSQERLYLDRHIPAANHHNTRQTHTDECTGQDYLSLVGGIGGACVSARGSLEDPANENGSTDDQTHRRDQDEERRHDHDNNRGNEPQNDAGEAAAPEGASASKAPRIGGAKQRANENDRKTTLQIATLNVNGFGCLVRDHPDNKWGTMYRMMKEHRIGVLLLQETHLTVERKASLEKMFAKKIRIFHSEHPDAPTQKEGVAVVLNCRYLNASEATAVTIVPGRAIQVSVRGPGGDVRNLLCVYAPTSNGVNERKLFFKEISKYYEAHPECPKPHLMAGDFNNVEDALDRLPVGEGPDQSILALDELKEDLGLMLADGWRMTYPSVREYTFQRGDGRNAVFSRLDRIYIAPALFDNAREWRICDAGVKTDHSLVLVQLTSENAPVVGPGRPIFPLQLLKDKTLARSIRNRGLQAMNELELLATEGGRAEVTNAQTILCNFKRDAMKLARTREREVVPKLLADIRDTERALRATKASKTLAEANKIAEAAALAMQLRQLKQRRFKQQQQNSRATHRLYGDRPTKYWSRLHRECAPRDLIHAFEKEGQLGVSGEKTYESDPAKMAEMARTHHMNVQRDGPEVRQAEEREADIAAALGSIAARVPDDRALELGGEITYDECLLSLRCSKSGSAPGLDGLPFEFWKTLHARFTEDSRFPSRASFDVVKLLTAAFEDMRTNGVSDRTSLAHGWIAPIYKEKGERTKVVNYRPITLLNTDYKLLSKSIAVWLAEVAPTLIHRAQAGFVPGRKIQNHTQLARMMMEWSEKNDQNGAIVALDQEKAYDKIAHDYLWRVLERFGIPETLVQLIKSLYQHAVTSVMINGTLSRAYRIYRGVRQGDPLSCLLFDLAIEPLSAMIRASAVRGFNIPQYHEALKAVLFADDTTVYLSSNDDFDVLQRVLDTWCSAAKARFNMSKTEIIPLGNPAYRDKMAQTYRTTGAWMNYPRGVHIAQEGEAVRILGAFFGNGVDQVDIWTLVLTKLVAMKKPLMHAIERWKTGHATLQGKKHVVQMIVGGMTQFLTTVQRMPEIIVTRLNKIIRGYLWNDRHNTPVGMAHLYLPVDQGGLDMLDLETRSEAIDIMWLKTYLDFSSERPIWAFLADDLLANYVTKACRPKSARLRVNTFLQRWSPRIHGLPAELNGLMSIARKYGLRLEGLAFSKDIQRSMPMWDHAHTDKTRLGHLQVPSKLLDCLQLRHNAMTVNDFLQLAEVLNDTGHKPKASCKCARCAALRTTSSCTNPHQCATRAKAMADTLPAKWDPRTRQPEDYEQETMRQLEREGLSDELVPFDRRVTTHGNIGHAFRIFTEKGPTSDAVAAMELDEDGTSVEIATDGSCLENGEKSARAGAGVFVAEGSNSNRSVRLPGWMEQSNQTGEATATLIATSVASARSRVTQITDSQTTMDSLSRWRSKHEDTGFILQKNADITRATLAKLRMRHAHTIFKWVRGHNGHASNEAADLLAAAGARKPVEDSISLAIPDTFKVTGAKLQALTQKLAYRAIRRKKDKYVETRPRTEANMNRITSGIQAAFGIELHDATVWRSFRSKHVARTTSQFLWMAAHDGYMLGTHWMRTNMSDELRARAVCGTCGEIETMSHVVLECNAGGQEILWNLLKATWAHTSAEWKEPSWGTSFGAACAVFKAENGCRKVYTEQLWCILCTETLHLIWKLRCERVIQNGGAEFTVNKITNRYYATLEARLMLDRRTAMMGRGKKALRPQDVERIWLPVLEVGDGLPPKWVGNNGVLVGIKRGR